MKASSCDGKMTAGGLAAVKAEMDCKNENWGALQALREDRRKLEWAERWALCSRGHWVELVTKLRCRYQQATEWKKKIICQGNEIQIWNTGRASLGADNETWQQLSASMRKARTGTEICTVENENGFNPHCKTEKTNQRERWLSPSVQERTGREQRRPAEEPSSRRRWIRRRRNWERQQIPGGVLGAQNRRRDSQIYYRHEEQNRQHRQNVRNNFSIDLNQNLYTTEVTTLSLSFNL
jgi:hypothetical protein